ncbi:hypothetical protein Scep_012567 [Stephania cephalantha]|uniref:Uncharacterized protein n=1 Tax=Stephania cephalantha TaxID=152367 RepID=A0AAP0JFL0_9MAGN
MIRDIYEIMDEVFLCVGRIMSGIANDQMGTCERLSSLCSLNRVVLREDGGIDQRQN